MGIDYKVESTINSCMYGEEPCMYDDNPCMYDNNYLKYYLNYAWRDLDWEFILGDILNIHLYKLYDNTINYWSVDQVVCMRNMLQKLNDFPEEFHIYEDMQNTKNKIELKKDISTLLDFFNFYVDNKCIIRVF